MRYDADSPAEYVKAIPEDRRSAFKKLRATIRKHLPEGFRETMSYGMIGYVVPHSIYPDGYHCDPKLPLPFMNIANQKHYIALYHSGIYADKKLHDWFVKGYREAVGKKPDMGKSCIRFKKIDEIPYELIGELVEKMSLEDWVSIYEKSVKR